MALRFATTYSGLPELRLEAFSGPLDLLCALIDRQKIDIYDIPIAEVTVQYLDYLRAAREMDMDLASDFLLMAATLLQIKSRMLLPKQENAEGEAEDPREELVLRLLEYRRCRLLAAELKARQARCAGACLRLPESAARLGIEPARGEDAAPGLIKEGLLRAAAALNARNGLRFNDLSERLTHILRREKISLTDKMRGIWQRLRSRGAFFFSELFGKGASRGERVTAFLAVLELLRGRRVEVRQESAFAPLWIGPPEGAAAAAGEEEQDFARWLESARAEEPEQGYRE